MSMEITPVDPSSERQRIDVSSLKDTPTSSSSNVRVKNRRKRYLDLHPEYFGPHLELSGLLEGSFAANMSLDEMTRSVTLRSPCSPFPNPNRTRSRGKTERIQRCS